MLSCPHLSSAATAGPQTESQETDLVADLLDVVGHLAELLRVVRRAHVRVVGSNQDARPALENVDAALALLATHHLLVVAEVHELLAFEHDAGGPELLASVAIALNCTKRGGGHGQRRFRTCSPRTKDKSARMLRWTSFVPHSCSTPPYLPTPLPQPPSFLSLASSSCRTEQTTAAAEISGDRLNGSGLLELTPKTDTNAS